MMASGKCQSKNLSKYLYLPHYCLTLLCIPVCILTLYQLAPAQYAGGHGTLESPFLIAEPNHLNNIGLNTEHWDKYFKLTNEIDLSQFIGTDFNIIGTYIGYNNPGNAPFTGIFDGDNHSIINFSYSSSGEKCGGVFGYINDPNAKVKNVRLINPIFDLPRIHNVGALVGYMDSGNIDKCFVEGGSISGGNYIGGLVGFNESGNITNCHSTCSVSGLWYVGGLVGYNRLGDVTDCYSTSTVEGYEKPYFHGGLVGFNYKGTIKNCYAKGSVTCIGYMTSDIGGLVGQNYKGNILNCYAVSSVSVGTYAWSIGGLVGMNFGKITDCYASGFVNGDQRSFSVGGLVGYNLHGVISRSYANSSVTANKCGGLVGYNIAGNISHCYASGSVTGGDNARYLGGLVGNNDGSNSYINNCYAVGSVSAGANSASLGGLVGINLAGSINMCYSTGSVVAGYGSSKLGGMIGSDSGALYNACFWDTDASGMMDGVGNLIPDPAGVEGKTTVEMKAKLTYIDAGWDLSKTWIINDMVSYPLLMLTKHIDGDLNGDGIVNLLDFAIFAANYLKHK